MRELLQQAVDARKVAQKLRAQCEVLRYRPIPLNHLIPLMQQAADVIESALQQPDPATRPSMSMFASAADYNAAMDRWLAPPALQQQEEKGEPTPSVSEKDVESMMRMARRFKSGITAENELRAYFMVFTEAASPSTPVQQEAGDGERGADCVTAAPAPHYWCNKCGYSGPVQVGHQRPHGSGECDYMAAPVTPGVMVSDEPQGEKR